MAKEIKFNIKLNIDGKEQLVSATSTVENLRGVVNAAKSDIQKANAVFVNFNQQVMKLQNINGAVQQLASTLNSVTEESRTFGAAMNVANTMAGKSGDDFAKLKGQVTELSKTLPIARDQLANGLYQVISNGVPEDNWLEYLQKSAKASIGGVADLGETVKVTSTIIKNYGLQWDAAESVQDKIQLTAKNGVTSFEQLAQALPRVTGNAATLGVSIDELLASFATLTGVSGNTNEVATQMAAIFTALVKPSSEAAKMAQQMGIEFDAAAIKAAGGMRNFLTNLDKDVKAYAAKSGMLEQEIYGKLFGSAESLRALGPLTGQLAAKFGENVDAMKGSAGTIDDAFGKVANSGSAAFQMFQNQMSEYTDAVASAVSGIMPAVNIMAKLGNTAVSILALNKALQIFCGINAITKTRIIATNAAALVWNATSVRVNAIVKVMSASFRGAAVSATTLKLAIQGLLISTSVGVALVALTEVIAAFTSKSAGAQTQAKDTADSMKVMGDAADEIKTAYDSALKNTYADLMAKYEKLKVGWRTLSTEQQKMGWIKENQSAFNELRLKISDVTEAENIFNRKTDVVVEAFKQRAMAAAYAAKLTALYQKQISLLDKKQKITKDIANDAKQSGRHANEGDVVPESWRNDRYGRVDKAGQWRFTKIGAERYNGTNVSGNAQVNAVDTALTALNNEISGTEKLLADQLKAAGKYITADKPPVNFQASAKTGKQETQAPKTYVEQLRAQLAEAQKEMGNAMTIEARIQADAKVRDIQSQIDEATKGKITIEAETDPSYIVQGSVADMRQSRSNAQQLIDQIKHDYEAGIIAEKESAEKRIAEINNQLADLGLKPIDVHFKSHAEELQEQLNDARREFSEATTIEARVKADAKIGEIQRQIDDATKGRLTIEAETEPGYITPGSAADRRQSYVNAQSRASRIQTDFEIGLIGKDEAQRQIADLNKQIADMGDNLKPLKLEVDASGFNKAMGDIKSGWGSVQGIGNGIQGISDALEGNGNAWQQVTGLINGFISIAEGIQGIVALFQMLTAATTAHAAAATTDAAATTGEAAAAAVNTSAKSGEAVANATASGAKMPFPLNLVAIAAGVAAVVAALAAVTGFATGGVIGGTSTSGDKKFARVNSGEMILNKFQQAKLFGMITGKYQPPTFTDRKMPPVMMGNITSDVEMPKTEVNVNLNANARKMLDALTDVKRVTKKSGRNYNV